MHRDLIYLCLMTDDQKQITIEDNIKVHVLVESLRVRCLKNYVHYLKEMRMNILFIKIRVTITKQSNSLNLLLDSYCYDYDRKTGLAQN